jgi:predicted dehydrogenase
MIGCGDVTEAKSAPALNKIPHSRLVAVMRRDRDKVQDYARRHNIPKWTTDAAALINDPEVNAVYVATPPDTHAAYTIQAARAGKAVYVEKPMARNHAECEAMLAACAAAKTPLFVAYYRRSLPAYCKIKDLVTQGTLGAIRLVTIQMVRPVQDTDRQTPPPWRVQPALSGGGHFVDLAPHQLDFLDYLFGPITHVQGMASNQAGLYPAEDLVCATFSFASEVLGVGSWCFTGAPCSAYDGIEIIGTLGRLRFSTFDHHVPIQVETDRGLESIPFDSPQHIQQPLMETVVASLCGQGTCPSTGVSAARTTRVIDQILDSFRRQT